MQMVRTVEDDVVFGQRGRCEEVHGAVHTVQFTFVGHLRHHQVLEAVVGVAGEAVHGGCVLLQRLHRREAHGTQLAEVGRKRGERLLAQLQRRYRVQLWVRRRNGRRWRRLLAAGG